MSAVTSTSLTVHYCKFIDTPLSPIRTIDIDQTDNRLVLARENGRIEFWNISNNAFSLNSTIHPAENFTKVIKISFFTRKKREYVVAFSRKNGIKVIDIDTLKEKTYPSHGGKIYSAEINPNSNIAAVGCQDGSVKLFCLRKELVYKASLAVSSEKIRSVAWSPSEPFKNLAVGDSAGSITLWDTASKKNILTIAVKGGSVSAENKSDSPVSVLSLLWHSRTNTIISGDSAGQTLMFDATTGTRTAAFREHTLPVRCLAASRDAVHSSGRDSRVASFTAEAGGGWCRSGLFRPQPRSVAALRAGAGGARLFLGGANCTLTAVFLGKRGRGFFGGGGAAAERKKRKGGSVWERHWEHFDEAFGPNANIVTVITKLKLVICPSKTGLKIWRLGQTDPAETATGSTAAKVLAEVETAGGVRCCGASDDLSLLFYSDSKGFHLFETSYVPGKIEEEKIRLKEIKEIKLKSVAFAKIDSKNKILYLLSENRKKIDFYDIGDKTQRQFFPSGEQLDFNVKIDIFEHFGDKMVIGLSTGRILITAASDAAKTVSDVKIDFKNGAGPTGFVACGLNCDRSVLVVVLRGNELLALDLKTGRFVEYFYKYEKRIKRIFDKKIRHQLIDIGFHTTDRNIFYAYNPRNIIKIDISKPPPPPTPLKHALSADKKLKLQTESAETIAPETPAPADGEKSPAESSLFSDTDDGAFDVTNFCVVSRFKPFLFRPAGDDAVVVVERDWDAAREGMRERESARKYSKGV